jgi:hypothetical protein
LGNRTQNSRHALSLRPRFRPGLHGRGKCAVGRTVVGTAGALPALHQDISAPGKGLGGDSNFGQVTTAPFLLVKIIRVGIVCQFSCHCLLIRRVLVVFRLVKWLGVVVSTAACWGNLSFTYSFTLLTFCRQQVKLQRNMMPKLRLSAKQVASEFRAAKALESCKFLQSGRQCRMILVRKERGGSGLGHLLF